MIKKLIKELEARQFQEPYVAGINYALGVIARLEKESMPDGNFDIFWKTYPNKKAKPVALKKWKTLKVDDELFQKIMSALEAHKKTPQWTKDDGQYIPHPSTWLNQRRWEDELKSEKSSENQSKFGHLS